MHEPLREQPVAFRLDGADALVLFAFLGRGLATGRFEVAHAAERHVLAAIHDALEGDLRAPVEPHYDEALAAARAQVEREAAAG